MIYFSEMFLVKTDPGSVVVRVLGQGGCGFKSRRGLSSDFKKLSIFLLQLEKGLECSIAV